MTRRDLLLGKDAGAGMRDIRKVKMDLVAFELEALSLLLHHWIPGVDGRGLEEWKKKLPKFRAGVIAGRGGGQRQKWPHELVEDDYETVLDAVRWAKENGVPREDREKCSRWLRKNRVPYIVRVSDEKTIEFLRPFPASERTARALVCAGLGRIPKQPIWRDTDEVVARWIVGQRVFVSASTVRNATKSDREAPRRFESRAGERLLASIFLDIASDRKKPHWKRSAALILDALYAARYPLIAIYYLAQKAHSLPAPIYVGSYDAGALRRLCLDVSPCAEKHRPFVKLLSGRRPC